MEDALAFPIYDGHRFTLSYITLCYYILLYVTVINLRYIYLHYTACMQYPIHVQKVSRHIDENVRITTTIFKAQIITSTQFQSYCGNRKRTRAAYSTHRNTYPIIRIISKISNFIIATFHRTLDFIRSITTKTIQRLLS